MRIKWIDGTELCVEPPAPQEDRLLSQNAILEAMNAWDWQELYLPIHFKQLLEEVPPAQPEIVLCRDCIHNPKETWFECPMAHLSEKQKPDTAWCWKGQRRAE